MGDGALVRRSDTTRDPGFPILPSLLSWGLGWVGKPSIWVKNRATSEPLPLILRPGSGRQRGKLSQRSAITKEPATPSHFPERTFGMGTRVRSQPEVVPSAGYAGILRLELKDHEEPPFLSAPEPVSRGVGK